MDAAQVSVIVPVYNGGSAWTRCLDALLAARPAPGEVIVVDDGSTDGSPEQATGRGLTVLHTERVRSGPAVARNLGALYARGEILFFLDGDVMIYPDTIGCVAAAFQDNRVSAIFGSYDDAPSAKPFVSQYKNLLHHYVHQTSRNEATSFWAGCGAIRKDVFRQIGGFAFTYTRPSVEDIELGYRLRRANYQIRLVKDLQVKHLKHWTLRSLLITDIFDRAMPWAGLVLSQRDLPTDLNLQLSHRLSTLLCFLLILTPFGFWLSPFALVALPFLIAAILTLNFDLYRFFYTRRGLLFVLGAIPMHWLYFLYSGTAFGVVLLLAILRNSASLLPSALAPRSQTNLPH